MLPYSGSLPREHIRDTYADGSWDKFNELVERVGEPDEDEAKTRPIGFYFLKPEIIPHNGHGVHRFLPDGHAVQEFEVRHLPLALARHAKIDWRLLTCRYRLAGPGV